MNIIYLYQYLIDITESDPRTKIQRPQAGIKGLGFFYIYNL